MEIKIQNIETKGIKFSAQENGQEIGRAYLYLIYNSLHDQPYGFLEDVWVSEDARGQGMGTQLVQAVIDSAKKNNCTKLIGTSRLEREGVHGWYEKLGFKKYGFEFRIDF